MPPPRNPSSGRTYPSIPPLPTPNTTALSNCTTQSTHKMPTSTPGIKYPITTSNPLPNFKAAPHIRTTILLPVLPNSRRVHIPCIASQTSPSKEIQDIKKIISSINCCSLRMKTTASRYRRHPKSNSKVARHTRTTIKILRSSSKQVTAAKLVCWRTWICRRPIF